MMAWAASATRARPRSHLRPRSDANSSPRTSLAPAARHAAADASASRAATSNMSAQHDGASASDARLESGEAVPGEADSKAPADMLMPSKRSMAPMASPPRVERACASRTGAPAASPAVPGPAKPGLAALETPSFNDISANKLSGDADAGSALGESGTPPKKNSASKAPSAPPTATGDFARPSPGVPGAPLIPSVPTASWSPVPAGADGAPKLRSPKISSSDCVDAACASSVACCVDPLPCALGKSSAQSSLLS
mmetsp:Transcript_1281/g.5119  ORF Transcript_1281/g.5119 Transcript_1281/m.5119 type:complete len:254 (+) Transcript_1281:419-1180(+)